MDAQGFAAAMRRLAVVAPGELDDAMGRVARRVVLPAARRTLRGSLAGSTVVKPSVKGAAFVNTKVYANVHHWGGHTWHAQSRVGKAQNAAWTSQHGSGIRGTRSLDPDSYQSA